MMLARLGSANEIVIGYLERLPQVLEQRRLAVAPRLRRIEPIFLGRFGDLFAMLVHAGEEFNVVAHCSTITSLHIGENRRIRGAQMRRGVHIIDGRGDEK